jgi:hypothetical protein
VANTFSAYAQKNIDGGRQPYDANDVTLEERAMWVIDANGDARVMWELILRDFLLQGIIDQ